MQLIARLQKLWLFTLVDSVFFSVHSSILRSASSFKSCPPRLQLTDHFPSLALSFSWFSHLLGQILILFHSHSVNSEPLGIRLKALVAVPRLPSEAFLPASSKEGSADCRVWSGCLYRLKTDGAFSPHLQSSQKFQWPNIDVYIGF